MFFVEVIDGDVTAEGVATISYVQRNDADELFICQNGQKEKPIQSNKTAWWETLFKKRDTK